MNLDAQVGSREVSRVLLGLLSFALVPFNSMVIGSEVGNPSVWLSLCLGCVSGVYALGAWVPAHASGDAKRDPAEIGLRIVAGLAAIVYLNMAWVSLFMAGSLPLSIAFLLWVVVFGLFSATGWNPVGRLKAGAERRRSKAIL